MSEDSQREIKIGDSTYTIRRFKGLKAALAGALISRVMRELPELQNRAQEFRKKYRESNTIMITAAMAKLPRFEGLGLTDADFRASNGKIEFPEEPDQSAILVNIFPDLFDLAQKELQKFLAIIVIPNSELEAADDADDIEGELTKWGKRLLRQGDIDELLELIVVGLDVLRDQMAAKRDVLGKLPIPMLQWLLAEETPSEEQEPEELETPLTMEELENNGHGQSSPIPTETSPSPSPSSAQPSSSDSPNDSTGTEEPLSTPSPGMN